MIDVTKLGDWNEAGSPYSEADSYTNPYAYNTAKTQSSTGQANQTTNNATQTGGSSAYQWDMPTTNPNNYSLAFDYSDPNSANVKQQWYRDPNSGGYAGNVVWNPYYGWQDQSAVKNYYTSQTSPVTWADFTTNAPFKQQMGSDWSQYYSPDRYSNSSGTYTDPSTGYTYSTAGWDSAGSGTTGATSTSNTTNPTYGSTFDFSQIPMSNEYNTASDLYNWMAYSGQPTDTTAAYQAAKTAGQYDTNNAIANAAEQAGLGGTRWSTPLGYTAQNIAGQNAANLASQYAQQTMSAQENARNRQMSSAQGLGGLGEYQQNYAQGLANQSMGAGSLLNTTDQNTLDKLYQYWQSQQGYNNPWLSSALGLGTGTGTAQTYDQSTLSSLLGTGTSAAGILALLKLAGVLSSIDFKKDIREVGQNEEEALYNAIKDTPLFEYRYKFEPDTRAKHLGLIVEESPEAVTVMDRMVGLYEYIGALHATIKTLIRKLEEK